METLTVRQTYKAPVSRAFEVFTDLQKAAERIKAIKQIELISGTSVAPNARWKELRRCGWRDAWMEFSVTEFTPEKSYTIISETGGTLWTTQFEFAPVAGGTEVAVTMQWQPKWLMMRLFNGMIRRKITEGMKQDFEDVRQAIEESI